MQNDITEIATSAQQLIVKVKNIYNYAMGYFDFANTVSEEENSNHVTSETQVNSPVSSTSSSSTADTSEEKPKLSNQERVDLLDLEYIPLGLCDLYNKQKILNNPVRLDRTEFYVIEDSTRTHINPFTKKNIINEEEDSAKMEEINRFLTSLESLRKVETEYDKFHLELMPSLKSHIPLTLESKRSDLKKAAKILNDFVREISSFNILLIKIISRFEERAMKANMPMKDAIGRELSRITLMKFREAVIIRNELLSGYANPLGKSDVLTSTMNNEFNTPKTLSQSLTNFGLLELRARSTSSRIENPDLSQSTGFSLTH